MLSIPISVDLPGQNPRVLRDRVDGWWSTRPSGLRYRVRDNSLRVFRRERGWHGLPSGFAVHLIFLADGDTATHLIGRVRHRVITLIILGLFALVSALFVYMTIDGFMRRTSAGAEAAPYALITIAIVAGLYWFLHRELVSARDSLAETIREDLA